MEGKLRNCKACNNEIGAKVKKCPSCGTDQRSFFGRHKILTGILIVLALVGISSALTGEESIDYKDYAYGEVIKKDNVVEDSKFKIPEGLEISIDSQELLTKAEIDEANIFNDANNDVVILTISMENKSDEPVAYNSLGFKYVTKEGVQLDDSLGTFNVLPDKYSSKEMLGAGDLMPGSKFTRLVDVEVPEGDLIDKVILDYSGVKFTVKLPD